MDSVISGSGDKPDPVDDVTKDDGKTIKDNETALQPIEQCGDKKCEEALVENYNDKYDSVVLPKNEHCDDYENTLSSSTDNYENIRIKDACSHETSDISMPDITERITECKNIIASLKLELNGEKNKLKQEYQYKEPEPEIIVPCKETNSANYLADLSYPTDFFTANVDNKLCSDKNLIEYEKQLQKYQRTLNMAKNAKKNAIRKQMLAKAFRLKLLEVENQCNIELLRIKQNLQCLEPLKMIAETWKTDKNNSDLSKYNLLPLFPEIYTSSTTNESNSAEGSDFEQN